MLIIESVEHREKYNRYSKRGGALIYIMTGMAGALGAALRYAIGELLYTEGAFFPIATLSVNLLGSFLMAWLAAGIFTKISVPDNIKTAVTSGFIGSFTTFSAFSIETLGMFQEERMLAGGLYILASLFGGVLLSYAGYYIGAGRRQLR